jgi:hypothetical protein
MNSKSRKTIARVTNSPLVGKVRKILIPASKGRKTSWNNGIPWSVEFRLFPFVWFSGLSRCYKRNLLYFSFTLLEWKGLSIKKRQNQSFSNKRDYKIPTFPTRPQISKTFTTFSNFWRSQCHMQIFLYCLTIMLTLTLTYSRLTPIPKPFLS